MAEDEDKLKILLFGRTGSGKSTLANVLFHWSPECRIQKFGTSAGIRGKTVDVQREESDKLVIVDTVGFGETEEGSVSHEEAKNVLYNFFMKTRGESYNYIIYVQKWGKLDLLDNTLWAFFKSAFGGSQSNFVVVFTHSTPRQLEEHKDVIEKEFDSCSRFISVDFPEFPAEINVNTSEKEKAALMRKQKTTALTRKRSFERLDDGLNEYFQFAVVPRVLQTLSKGRILLIGRYPETKSMIRSMLVSGSTSFSAKDCRYSDPEGAFEEAEGRGWEIVNATAFESYRSLVADCNPEEGALRILHSIFLAIRHGLYSHIVYVEELRFGMKSTKAEKLVWEVITRLLTGSLVEENLVALIANVSGKRIPPAELEKTNKLTSKFSKCKTFLYLDLPRQHNNSSSKKIATGTTAHEENPWKTSLQALERILSSSSTERVGIQLSDLDEEEKWLEQMSRYLVPLVKGLKSPKLQWLHELDPLSSLSRRYKEIMSCSRNLSSSPATTVSLTRVSSDDTFHVTTHQYVVGYSDMTHLYLEIESEVDSVKTILVEVHSHDQGWSSSNREDHGTYRHSYTWGELVILSGSKSIRGKHSYSEKNDAGRLRVYTNLHAVDEWQVHCKTVQRDSGKGSADFQFLEKIKKGDKIALFLRSQGPGWANFSKFGSIELVPHLSKPGLWPIARTISEVPKLDDKPTGDVERTLTGGSKKQTPRGSFKLELVGDVQSTLSKARSRDGR